MRRYFPEEGLFVKGLKQSLLKWTKILAFMGCLFKLVKHWFLFGFVRIRLLKQHMRVLKAEDRWVKFDVEFFIIFNVRHVIVLLPLLCWFLGNRLRNLHDTGPLGSFFS
jgi:hypothetical protein